MNIVLVQDGKQLDETLLTNRNDLFQDELIQKLYKRQLLKKVQDHIRIMFVGILWYHDTLLLSLPKSIDCPQSMQEQKYLLTKYASLFDQYGKEHPSFTKHNPYLKKGISILSWCEQFQKNPTYSETLQQVVVARFQDVFEWMLTKFFVSNLKRKHNKILLDSQFLKEEADINEREDATYIWKPINVYVKDEQLNKRITQSRQEAFQQQDKINIPDLVCEQYVPHPKTKEERKCCFIIDAKYYNWNEELQTYHLPNNLSVYKQFFYQEQLYNVYQNKNAKDIYIYNVFILPDFLGDCKKQNAKLVRNCATIQFKHHAQSNIIVLQVDIAFLVDLVLSNISLKRRVLPFQQEMLSEEEFQHILCAMMGWGKDDVVHT